MTPEPTVGGTRRYVILGLSQPRASWIRALAQWANSSSVPVELVKCVSAEELRARLAGRHTYSAALIDAETQALDRDLIGDVAEARCPTIVVQGPRLRQDWRGLGAAEILPETFGRQDLLAVLAQHCVPIATADAVPGALEEARPHELERGLAVMVCGSGGTGSSTVSIALAQGLSRRNVPVLLADFALRAEQAMLHDARDIIPGVQELVEAHRTGGPSTADVVGKAFDVVERGYHLLLGLRRPPAWPVLRTRAFEAAFDSLLAAYEVVVCDTDSDLEGESDSGSIEVQERNVMSRTTASRADVVLPVGQHTMKGLHSLAVVIIGLLEHDVPPDRIIPIVNRAQRQARQRSAATTCLASLVGSPQLASPIFLPERRVDEALRDGVVLPAAIVNPLVGAFDAILSRTQHQSTQHSSTVLARPLGDPPARELVRPGSLGFRAVDRHSAASTIATGQGGTG